MYSGQHRTSKKSSNSSDKAVPSRFAPRGFVVQPKTEEVTPQQDQTPEEQTQKEEPKQYESGLIDGSKWRPGPPARTPRIQMKLTPFQPGDMYQQQPVSSNPVAIQPQANTDLSSEQNPTLEPFEKADEVANQAVEIQRLSESGESGDEDSNSANGGTIQRACSLCETEKSPVQTKLTIGSTGDKYEQEADSMAERVMSMDTPTATNGQTIQRLGEEQEQPQQPLSASVTPLVQRLSELVQRMAEVKASTNETLVNFNKEPLFTSKQDHVESTQLPWLQPKHINRVNARPGTEAKYLDNRSHTETSTAEEQTIQHLADETLQRSENSDATSATPSLENRLGSQTGGGTPLDEQTRSFMEPRFGNDFSSVRVHTDSSSVEMNRELGAQAFTHGQDVYFGAGKYNPGADDGKRLLAHELTHVVQQTGAVQRKPDVEQQSEVTPDKLINSTEEIQAKDSLEPKTLPGKTPELPLNKDPLKLPQQMESAASGETSQIGQDTEKTSAPEGGQADAEQAASEVDPGKVEEKKNEVLAQQQPQIEQVNQQIPEVEQTAQQASETAQEPAEPIVAPVITAEPPQADNPLP